jgi:uroporphyrinogen decarboxylase
VTNLFLDTLAGKTGPRPPFWFMRQAGRYLPEYREVRAKADGFLDLCYTPDRAARVTLQPIERFRPDAAILFSDILVVPHAIGQNVGFVEGKGPVLEPVQSARDLAALDPGRTLDHLAPVFETVRLVRAELPEDVALIGFSGAPWTVATYMIEGGSTRDFNTVKSWAISHRSEFSILLDLLVESTSAYLIAQVEAGAQALQLFDTWASAVPAAEFDNWVCGPTARIVAAVKADCRIISGKPGSMRLGWIHRSRLLKQHAIFNRSARSREILIRPIFWPGVWKWKTLRLRFSKA